MIVKYLKRILVGIGVFIVLILIVTHCFGLFLKYSASQSLKQLQSQELTCTDSYLNINGYNIHYIEVQSTTIEKDSILPLLVFIHGAPGSWADFEKYLQDSELLDKYRMISIDRLGYGSSQYGQPVTAIHDQSESIQALIKQKRKKSSKVIN